MAMSAMYGELQPHPDTANDWSPNYSANSVPGYRSFPKPGLIWNIPVALAYILTTHNNPLIPNSELVPLYRLSHQTTNGANELNVDHTYATLQREIDYYQTNNYQLDSIEGYIYPDYKSQPEGTVKLYRQYNPRYDDQIRPHPLPSLPSNLIRATG
jgi:hypothetical protein